MADKAGAPSSKSTSQFKKLTAINQARPGNEPPGGGRIKLKGGAGRPLLLPSKVGVPQQTGPLQQDNNNGSGDGRAKPWKSGMGPPAAPPPSAVNSRQSLLDAQYGNYLQSFLEAALMVEMNNLQRLAAVDGMGSKCISIAMTERQINKNAADFRTTKILSGLSHLEWIHSAFKGVLELTGLEILVEIQNILSDKHDMLKLEVESGILGNRLPCLALPLPQL